jgi:hypothetical protein
LIVVGGWSISRDERASTRQIAPYFTVVSQLALSSGTPVSISNANAGAPAKNAIAKVKIGKQRGSGREWSASAALTKRVRGDDEAIVCARVFDHPSETFSFS